jgi:hypothetical protein
VKVTNATSRLKVNIFLFQYDTSLKLSFHLWHKSLENIKNPTSYHWKVWPKAPKWHGQKESITNNWEKVKILLLVTKLSPACSSPWRTRVNLSTLCTENYLTLHFPDQLFSFSGSGDSAQSFVLAWQTSYHLIHTTVLFQMRSCTFAWDWLLSLPPICNSWDYRYAASHVPCLWQRALPTLPGLASDCDPPVSASSS